MRVRLRSGMPSAVVAGVIVSITQTASAQSYMDRMGGGEAGDGVAAVEAPAAPKPAATSAPRPQPQGQPRTQKVAAVAPAPDPARTPATQASVDALLSEVTALREEVHKLAPVAPEPAPAEIPGTEELEAELAQVRQQIALLDAAVAGGLDPAVAAPTYAELESRSRDLQIAMVTPSGASTAMESFEEIAPEEDAAVGVAVDVDIESAYVFRGLNVFKSAGQGDQNALAAPSLGWSIGDTGAWVGYWGAYQVSGSNRSDMVAAGYGHEQDVLVGYDFDLSEAVSGSVSAVYYFYPFANPDVAGASNPSYIEPGVAISHAGPVDLGVSATYMHGVQQVLAPGRYLYVHGSAGKAIDVGGGLSLGMDVGAGYKVFTADPGHLADNGVDLSFGWTLDKTFSDTLHLTPSVHAAWTNFAALGPGDEYVVWFGLASGASL